MTRQRPTFNGTLGQSRRGVAMLLVIIALGSATVLAGSYLASRRNTGAIGQNAGLAVAAQWASRSGVDLGVAMMQTNRDWRIASVDGVLINDIDLSGALVRVMITNLEGEAPGVEDVDLILTSMASMGGVTSTTQRVVIAPANLSIDDALNPALDEFGVFTNSLSVENNGVLASWPLAPRGILNPPVKLGLNNGFASALTLAGGADLVNVSAWAPGYASSSLQGMLGSTSFTDSTLLDVMPPIHDSYAPGYAAARSLPAAGGASGNKTFTGSWDSGPIIPGDYEDVQVLNSAVMDLDGDYAFNSLLVDSRGVLVVHNDTTITVDNLLSVRIDATIEMADANASLNIYLLGEANIDRGCINVDRLIARDPGRTVDHITQYQDPRQVRIWGARLTPDRMSAIDVGIPQIRMDDSSIVIAAIHAPFHGLTIEDGAALLGRATAATVWIDTDSYLLADPTLDNRAGFTTPIGPLYTSAGVTVPGLDTAVAGLSQLNTVEEVADVIAPQLDLSDTALTLAVGSAGDPTPRGAVLAQSTQWPIIARSLEDPLLVTSDPTDGSLVEIKISYDDYLATVKTEYEDTQRDLDGTTNGKGGSGSQIIVN